MNGENAIKNYVIKVNKIFTGILMIGAIVALILALVSVLSTYIACIAAALGTAVSSVLIYKKRSEKIIMAVLLTFCLYCFVQYDL